MARFKLFIVGTTEAPVVEVPASNLLELNDLATRNRFIEGHMVEINGGGASCGVSIPVCRIQLIAEAD